MMRIWRHLGIALLLAALLTACADVPDMPPESLRSAFRLGAGDEVRLVVFGEDDLSGDFLVSSDGAVSLPLVGAVKIGGQTLPEAEQTITAAFSAGYLRQPRIALEVRHHRPFYILGEVQRPGVYPYVNGMTVIAAVAVGGGFTYRADEDDIRLSREGALPYRAPHTALVLPGDVIRVHQRLF